ncbi:MAG: helix-turn-helix transcriptional regulator [Actinobacteria bacterium]|jgi:DNA-binding CsgD family transcriptional regulator|nr:MAG: helix-turn-helix transcriptional regulator [Actinomycetota bacterium]
MLVGRDEEQAQIERLLEHAREGRGGSLVVRGEAGIGKTALLEDVVQATAGFRTLHALGVESEAELSFAGLHELVQPIVYLVDELPRPQAKALKAALALGPGTAVDPFAAYAGTLGLLAAAAAEQPLLCVVDDVHWLDQSSAEALVFAARRLEHDPVAILLAAREPGATAFATPGLPELRLEGLQSDEAKALLSARAPPLLPAVIERLVEAAGGNPLALLAFAPGEAEIKEIGEPLPVGKAVERAFLERSSQLSAGAQHALLLVAASDPGEPEALWAALESEGIDAASLAEAERAGLLARGKRVDFSHPLARSALYHSAMPAERRAAHLTLAGTTEAVDRRAWHLAAAASGADEEAAAALEQAAVIARGRGGVSAEAAALERAARLTPDPGHRSRRLFRAALAAEAAGRLERADELLAEVAELTADPELRADAIAGRSYLLFDRGEFDRAIELARAEADVAAPEIAARVLATGGVSYSLQHRLDLPAALQAAESATELAGDDAYGNLELCLMRVLTWAGSGRTEDALGLALECVDRVELGTVLAIDFATWLLYLEDYHRARDLFEQIVAHERQAVALGNLAYALDQLSRLETRAGRLTAAYAASLESLQLTEPLGNEVALAGSLAWLALVEATLGRSEAFAHGTHALQISEKRGDGWNEVRARAALGLDALARGDLTTAVDRLEPATVMLARGGVRNPNVFRVHGDLVEAQVRLGKGDEAAQQLGRLLEEADLTGSRWAAAVGARCRALLADDADAEQAFETTLELHEGEPSELERARTQLAYGERLRRLGQRRRARDHLHAALESFERQGARPWADRARAELRASGERLGRRGPSAHEQLTPQELQVSLAAAEGLTNKEIGARLFLSPKTVEFHLSHAYRKLDVRARGELIKLFAEQAAAPERLPA